MTNIAEITRALLRFKSNRKRKNSVSPIDISSFSSVFDNTKHTKDRIKNMKHFRKSDAGWEYIDKWFDKRFRMPYKPAHIRGKYKLVIMQFDGETCYEYIITPKKIEIYSNYEHKQEFLLLSKHSYQEISTEELFHIRLEHNILDVSTENINNIRNILSSKKRANYSVILY